MSFLSQSVSSQVKSESVSLRECGMPVAEHKD